MLFKKDNKKKKKYAKLLILKRFDLNQPICYNVLRTL